MNRRTVLGTLCTLLCLALQHNLAGAQPSYPSKDPSAIDAALIAAVDQRDRKQTEELLRRGANPTARNNRGMTALQIAIVSDSREIAQLLVTSGADVNAKSMQNGVSPLVEAAWLGRTQLVQYLISRNADVNSRTADGRTALIAAAYPGHRDAIEVLLKGGADINARNEYGETALWMAVLGRNTNPAIQLLLEKGADVNTKNKEGKSMLEVA
jgi:uncharacterized protein